MRRPIDAAGFQSKFEGSDDPWACRSAPGEALKRRRAFTGLSLVSSALDVACGDGAGTREIAARALRVDAVDGSDAAIASAARLIEASQRVKFTCVRLPEDLPRGRWRRIVVSELVYYLAPREIVALADALVVRLASGGALISVHHFVSFDDARTPPRRAVEVFRRRLGRHLKPCWFKRFGRYEISLWRSRPLCPSVRNGVASAGTMRLQSRSKAPQASPAGHVLAGRTNTGS